MLRRDAELLPRDLQDRPLVGLLCDLDVGFRIAMLRCGGRCRLRGGGGVRIHARLVPGVSLAFAANSPAASFGPPAAFTRKTLTRPSAQTTVKPSLESSTASSIASTPMGNSRSK